MFVADAHSDLLQELSFAEHELGEANPLRSRWLPPLERGNVALQVCALYVDPELGPDAGVDELLRQAESFQRAVRRNPDHVVAVHTAADVEALGRARIGLLLALEGAAAFQANPAFIDVLADRGVRMASLTWNERNAFAGGCLQPDGLTPLGERLVDRMLELGMAIDLAHASQRTFFDVLERDCAGRVLVSHAACRAVHDHPRNLSDRQLMALAERGGVLGVMPHPVVVDPDRPTVARFIAHVEHAASVLGLERVALGGDFLRQIIRALGEQDERFDGVPADAAIEGLEGPHHYPALADALRRRGWTDADIAAVMGENLVRFLGQALRA
jgi:membrane dipeptidase